MSCATASRLGPMPDAIGARRPRSAFPLLVSALGLSMLLLGCSAPSWSSQTESNFTANCVNSAVAAGQSQSDASAYCGCALRGLEAVYSESDFSVAEVEYSTGKPLPDKMTKVLGECRVNDSAH